MKMLLGVFMALFGFLTILASLGLVVFTMRKMQKGGSGLKIILYAIETVIPSSIVGALAWSAHNASYNPIAIWAGACLMGATNAFIFFTRPHKVRQLL
jgi:FtsH-binding integral membrane protein